MSSYLSFLVPKIFKKLGLKNTLAIALLATAEVFVFGLSYFLTVLLPRSWEYLHISEADVSSIIGVFGGVVLICQLPAGILADRFSNKKLILIGLVVSALALLWFGLFVQLAPTAPLIPPFYQYVLICIIWGVSSSLFFWTPMQRLVSQYATKEDQGLAYNLSNSVNGIVGTIFVWLTGLLIIWLIERFNNPALFAYYIYFSCATIILIFLLIQFTIKTPALKIEVSEELQEQKPKQSQLANLIALLKNWKLWALGFGVLVIVIYQGILGTYLKDFLSNTLILPAIWVTILGGLRLFVAKFLILPFASWMNKRGSFVRTLIILQILAALSLIPFILLPGFTSLPFLNLGESYFFAIKIILAILFVFTGLIAWLMVSIQFTQLVEIDRPANSYGLSIALIAFLSYSSRAWFTPIVSIFIRRNQELVDGSYFTSWGVYQAIFLISASLALLAALILTLVYLSNKRELKRLGKSDFKWRELANK